MFDRGNDGGRAHGQRALESWVDIYRGDFSSTALFVPIMAVANESRNSWVS